MHVLPADHAVLSLSPAHAPVLTIASGDEVEVTTMDCFSNTIHDEAQLFSSVGWDQVNPATGPIAVEGARPGDTIKVEVLSIEVGSTGTMTTHPDYGALPGTVDERTRRVDVVDGMVRFDEHLAFPIAPMIGVIGTAPAEEDVPTGTPKAHGGNMDTKRIAAGAVVYLPVEVAGANLALGDVHAAMGDGEVAVCGLEIAAVVRIRVSVISGRPLPLPFVVDDQHLMSIASAPELRDAVTESTRMMRDLLVSRTDLDPTDALMLLSLVGDTRISQIVDPWATARFELPTSVAAAYGIAVP